MVYRSKGVESRLGLEEEGRRLLIWATSRTDAIAAKKAGVSGPAWSYWRIRRNLPSQTDLHNIRRLAVWRMASSDREAAGMLGETPKAFSTWRESNDMPPCRGNPRVKHTKKRFSLDPLPAPPGIESRRQGPTPRPVHFAEEDMVRA